MPRGGYRARTTRIGRASRRGSQSSRGRQQAPFNSERFTTRSRREEARGRTADGSVRSVSFVRSDFGQCHSRFIEPRPVLREMERTMKSLDALRNDIEIIKREIQRYGPAYGRGRVSGEG